MDRGELPISKDLFGLSPEWLRTQIIKYRKSYLKKLPQPKIMTDIEKKTLDYFTSTNWNDFNEAATYLQEYKGLKYRGMIKALTSIRKKYRNAITFLYVLLSCCQRSSLVTNLILEEEYDFV